MLRYFDPQECDSLKENRKYLEQLLAEDHEEFTPILRQERTLQQQLQTLFPQYASKKKRLLCMLGNSVSFDRNEYLAKFAVILDGLNTTVPNESENLRFTSEFYTRTFGSVDNIPDDMIEFHADAINEIGRLEFLRGDLGVYDLEIDFDEVDETMKHESFFGGINKHFIGIGATTSVYSHLIQEPNSYSFGVIGTLALLTGTTSALRLLFPYPEFNYMVLQEKCHRTDMLLEHYRENNLL